MKDFIYEIEVDAPSRIEELPVSENNFIELDYSHLDNELEEAENLEELDDDFAHDVELDQDDDDSDEIPEDNFEDTDI